MLQRYRAILHLADPIIEAGHELVICIHGGNFSHKECRDHPTSVARATKGGLKYLMECFGITVNNWDKIKFKTGKPKGDWDLRLEHHEPEDKTIRLPYNGYDMFVENERYTVGNPLCKMVADFQKEYRELKDSVLIMHPGGGRGYISPVRKKLGKSKVDRNNVEFLNKVLGALPEDLSKITIKVHPFPYHHCTARALEKYVVPHLCREVFVYNGVTPFHLAINEYIINFSGTTAFWLRGSSKKLINITGMVKYPHRDVSGEVRGQTAAETPLWEILIIL